MNKRINSKKQDGAALVIGLILLVVITVLAISGMSTATTELAMARNDQYSENAFQAAEQGLAIVLGKGTFNTLNAAPVTQMLSSNEAVTTQIQYEDSSIVPDKAFSLGGGGGGIAAYHFIATSTAESLRDPGNPTDRDSSAVHTQAFYVVGPGSPTL